MSPQPHTPRNSIPPTPRPTPAPPNFEHLPAELTARRQWVTWRYEWRDDRWTKIPYQAKLVGTSHVHAKTNMPQTWTTFDAARAFFLAHRADLDGIGYIFAADDPYTGIDLDKCRDPQTGALESWAADAVNSIDSYTEESISGTGVHIIARATLPPQGRRKDHFEIYNDRRLFAVTGAIVSNHDQIADRQKAITTLHQSIWPPAEETETEAQQQPIEPLDIDDDALLTKIRNSRNAASFEALWQGNTSAYSKDRSRADAALAERLLWWTRGDVARADRLGRQSGLRRDKWDEARGDVTWWRYTLENIKAGMKGFYTPPVRLGGEANALTDIAEEIDAQIEEPDPVDQDDSPELIDVGDTADPVRLRAQIAALEAKLRHEREQTEYWRQLAHERGRENAALLRALGNRDIPLRDRVVLVASAYNYERARRRDELREDDFAIQTRDQIGHAVGISGQTAGDVMNGYAGAGLFEKRAERLQTSPYPANAVKFPRPLAESLERIATLEPIKEATHGGKSFALPHCPDCPDSNVLIKRTVICKTCGQVLGPLPDIERKPGCQDDMQCAGSDVAASRPDLPDVHLQVDPDPDEIPATSPPTACTQPCQDDTVTPTTHTGCRYCGTTLDTWRVANWCAGCHERARGDILIQMGGQR